MLVVTRKVDQAVMIGEDIVVRVVEVNGQQVRLGIEAPRQLGVWREEIYEQMQGGNRDGKTPPAA